MKKVAIVDYKLGNLFSVKQVCEKVGFQADITANVETILQQIWLRCWCLWFV